MHQFDKVAGGRWEIQVQVVLNADHVEVDGELGCQLYRVTLLRFDDQPPGTALDKDRLGPGSLFNDRF